MVVVGAFATAARLLGYTLVQRCSATFQAIGWAAKERERENGCHQRGRGQRRRRRRRRTSRNATSPNINIACGQKQPRDLLPYRSAQQTQGALLLLLLQLLQVLSLSLSLSASSLQIVETKSINGRSTQTHCHVNRPVSSSSSICLAGAVILLPLTRHVARTVQILSIHSQSLKKTAAAATITTASGLVSFVY